MGIEDKNFEPKPTRQPISDDPVHISRALIKYLDKVEGFETVETPFIETPNDVAVQAAQLSQAKLTEAELAAGPSIADERPFREEIKAALAKYNESQDPKDRAELERLEKLSKDAQAIQASENKDKK